MSETTGALDLALQALQDDRAQEAAELLKDHLWRDPGDALAYAFLGVALTEIGETTAALEALDRAHYLQPNDPRILYNYGLVLEAAGRYREARLRFSAALRLNPNYEHAMRHLARLEAGWHAGPDGAAQPRGPGDESAGAGSDTMPGPLNPGQAPGALGGGAGRGAGLAAPPRREELGPGRAAPSLGPGAVFPLEAASDPPVAPGATAAPPQEAAPPPAEKRRGILHTIGGVAAIVLMLAGFWIWLQFNSGTGDPTADLLAARRLERGALAGADMTRMDLRKAALNAEPMMGARLANANLQEAILMEADLTEADLTSANLEGARLEKANLARAVLIGARLAKASMLEAYCRDTQFTGVVAPGVRLDGAYLQGATLDYADLTGASLTGADLGGCVLEGVQLEGADLSNANLRGANLSMAYLRDAVLTGARYDAATRWPPGFNPKSRGAVPQSR